MAVDRQAQSMILSQSLMSNSPIWRALSQKNSDRKPDKRRVLGRWPTTRLVSITRKRQCVAAEIYPEKRAKAGPNVSRSIENGSCLSWLESRCVRFLLRMVPTSHTERHGLPTDG